LHLVVHGGKWPTPGSSWGLKVVSPTNKVVVSRDVIFNEEAWNWSSKEADKENVVSDEFEEQSQVVTPSASPTSPQPITPPSTHSRPTFTSSSSNDESGRGIPTPIRIGSLKDVYKHT
jgi:hypothetical protein